MFRLFLIVVLSLHFCLAKAGGMDSLKKVIAEQPTSWPTWVLLCQTSAKADNSLFHENASAFVEALELAKDTNALKYWYQANLYLSVALGRMERYEEALNQYQRMADSAQSRGHYSVVGKAYTNMGTSYVNRGLTEPASQMLNKAFDAYLLHGDEGKIVACLEVKAAIENESGRLEACIATAKELIKRARNEKVEFNQVYIYKLMALSLSELGDFDAGQAYFDSSFAQVSSRSDSVVVLNDWALALMKKDRYGEALDLLNKIDVGFGRGSDWNAVLHNKAICRFKTGDTTGVKAVFQKLIAYYQESENNVSLENIYGDYAEMLKLSGAYEQAVTYLQLADSLQLLLFEDRVTQEQLRLETQFSLKERDWQIENLEEENQLRKALLQEEERANRLLSFLAIGTALVAVIIFLLLAIVWRNRRVIQRNNLQLEQLNRTKDKLFRVLSHDLKNYLTALHISVKKLKPKVPEKSREELNDIEQAAQNNSDLLSKLLQWARAQLREGGLKKKSLYLVDVIEDVQHDLAQSIEAKGNKLQINCSEEVAVLANKTALEAILRNLVQNANKFTDQGEIIVSGSREGQKVLLQVADTGVGMSAEQLEKLRQNLSITSLGTSGEKGHGIGFQIIADYVSQHGASLKIDSTLGKGAIFSITFKK